MLLRFVYFGVAIETAWVTVCVATASPTQVCCTRKPILTRRTRVFAWQLLRSVVRGRAGAAMGVALADVPRVISCSLPYAGFHLYTSAISPNRSNFIAI